MSPECSKVLIVDHHLLRTLVGALSQIRHRRELPCQAGVVEEALQIVDVVVPPCSRQHLSWGKEKLEDHKEGNPTSDGKKIWEIHPVSFFFLGGELGRRAFAQEDHKE